jgi:hypothetical protein
MIDAFARLAMSKIELKTAKLFEAADGDTIAGFVSSSGADSTPATPLRAGTWEKAAAWVGVGAGLVVVCLALIAVPMLTGIKMPKAASPIDWWLWLGGAKEGQTFEKFVKDTAKRQDNWWDTNYKQSPMYQFQGIQPMDLNRMQGVQFNGPQTTQSPRRSR